MPSPERESTAAEELARHAEWLRRLARALAGDEAEDLEQATWERVLDDGVPDGSGLRPLLARIARSLAWRRRRADSRRRGWERAAARRDVWPSAAEIAARGELAEHLALALDALDESQRTVIVMRYFDGSSSAEIARQLGLPAATVRSRLKRGLEELRGHLGAHRDEGAGLVGWSWPEAPRARLPRQRRQEDSACWRARRWWPLPPRRPCGLDGVSGA